MRFWSKKRQFDPRLDRSLLKIKCLVDFLYLAFSHKKIKRGSIAIRSTSTGRTHRENAMNEAHMFSAQHLVRSTKARILRGGSAPWVLAER
jgi:hypothetical protein